MSMCVHNLAVINYIEICDFNDKGSSSKENNLMLDAIDNTETQKLKDQKDAKKTREELDILEREKLFK